MKSKCFRSSYAIQRYSENSNSQCLWLNKLDCDDRAKAFGNQVAHAEPKFNIVGLQEYYNSPDADIGTCNAKHVSNAIWSTGRLS